MHHIVLLFFHYWANFHWKVRRLVYSGGIPSPGQTEFGVNNLHKMQNSECNFPRLLFVSSVHWRTLLVRDAIVVGGARLRGQSSTPIFSAQLSACVRRVLTYIWWSCVTPQDVIRTQDVIIAARCNTIYARCNTYAKCNNFYARCNNTYQREM